MSELKIVYNRGKPICCFVGKDVSHPLTSAFSTKTGLYSFFDIRANRTCRIDLIKNHVKIAFGKINPQGMLEEEGRIFEILKPDVKYYSGDATLTRVA